MPVRKVIGKSGNSIGQFPSLKMQRGIAFESLIERDFLYLLDFERSIASFEEQPLTIEYCFAGKLLHYTPDFKVIGEGRTVLIECKPVQHLKDEDNQRRFRAALDWCMKRDWSFEIVTDQDLRAGNRLRNVKFLTRFARYNVLPQAKVQIFNVLSSTPTLLSIHELQRQSTLDPQSALVAIYYMAFHHQIEIPVEGAAISPQTLVSLPSRR